MNSMIYDPLEEFESKFKGLHLENTKKYLDELVERSGVDPNKNRCTLNEHAILKEDTSKKKKSLNLWRFLRVLMIISLVLIPLVIIKTTPKIKEMRKEIEQSTAKLEELMELARQQMQPLNDLFSSRDALNIIERTIPLISFAPCFSAEQETDMALNYDFTYDNYRERSTIGILSGHYNENPFFFENTLSHKMGTEVYHGYKTIYWTESYRGADGKRHTVRRSQTLHASVTKPKPFYSTQNALYYCSLGGPDLSFTRDATHLEAKSDKQIDRYVKKGEKKLKKMSDKAAKQNSTFTSMSNSDFEVLFDALDRTNELQFRTLFTPLAQTNMVSLIRSRTGYGDDFDFTKRKKTNKIVSQHSQKRSLTLFPASYHSHSFDVIKESFISKNIDFFKSVYFDFAPIWAIPIYQERPVHSLKPIPKIPRKYSQKQSEVMSNKIPTRYTVHPHSKTQAIIKATLVGSNGDIDEISVTSYSYNTRGRVDHIPVFGGDGRMHMVPVHWDEYIPLQATNNFYVAPLALTAGRNILAIHNDICIFN